MQSLLYEIAHQTEKFLGMERSLIRIFRQSYYRVLKIDVAIQMKSGFFIVMSHILHKPLQYSKQLMYSCSSNSYITFIIEGNIFQFYQCLMNYGHAALQRKLLFFLTDFFGLLIGEDYVHNLSLNKHFQPCTFSMHPQHKLYILMLDLLGEVISASMVVL